MSAHYEAFGKYVLLEKLATGGMAEVFLARGTGAGGIGKFFAIKRILPQYADSPEFIDMFKDEAKIAINLSHSNIVSIHEFGVEKGQFFLVMDYVEGRNLRQILNKMKKTNQQFTIDQIVYMVKEVSSGLDHAHRCIDGSTGKPLNITHRDMSPQNIMVSFEGEVKIVDFGIAKAESQLETTRAGTLKGKFGYMSPEQAEGQPVDLRTDIFSLGIVLWELLAGDRLFVANNEINTLRKIRDCQIPSLRKVNPNIHTELERIVQKGLARDRNLRYQTGAALHRDLNRFLNRQYPDFSPQDFAVFIKSVFADEILSLRKRLVDYSKVNLGAGLNAIARPVGDDETALLKTNTDSVVVTDTGGQGLSASYRNHTDVNAPDTTSSGSEMSVNSGSLLTDKTEITAPDPQENSDISVRERSTAPDDSFPPPNQKGAVQAADVSSGPALLDERALVEMNKDLSTSGSGRMQMQLTDPRISSSVETEEISSPGLRHDHRTPVRVRAVHDRERSRSRRERAKPARLATFLVFSLLCLSVYAYLVKYFTGTMCPVMQMTNPIFHGIHNALVTQNPCLRDVASHPGRPQGEQPGQPNQPQPQPAAPIDPPADGVAAKGASPAAPASDDREVPSDGLVVTSNPSGAEIYLNGTTTGMVTPSRITVPPSSTFNISVRKRGYQEFRRTEVTRESIGHRLDANLQKMNVGYLDIEIFPPQDAVLYVNGRQVPLHRNVAREIMVPGNTQVKVRAESRSTSTFDETTVTVGIDKRKSIHLNPRKMDRSPSKQ